MEKYNAELQFDFNCTADSVTTAQNYQRCRRITSETKRTEAKPSRYFESEAAEWRPAGSSFHAATARHSAGLKGTHHRLAFKPADVRWRAWSVTDMACRCDGRQHDGQTET